MEEMKQRLAQSVAEKLAGAPDSVAKSELIEELSDNLYRRYVDMTAAGTDPEEAFRAALDDLGDTDELVDYLNSLPPDEPLPGPEPEPQGSDLAGDLNEILKNVDEIVRTTLSQAMSAMNIDGIDGIVSDAMRQARSAVNHAKNAAKSARERMERERCFTEGPDGRYTYTSPHGHVVISVNPDKKDPEDEEVPWADELRESLRAEEECMRADLAMEGMPPEEIDRIVAQSMEDIRPSMETAMREAWEAEHGPVGGPLFYGRDSWMAGRPDGSYSVNGGLKSLDVEVGGSITIRMDDTPEDDVVIGGDVAELDVRSENGTLIIREGRTASRGFFFTRGLSAADVELTLPRRFWESIRVSTYSGDVELTGDVPLGTVSVSTTSGDVSGSLPQCDKLYIHVLSGDMEWRGCAAKARFSSVNGDISLEGDYGELSINSTNGDIDLAGHSRAERLYCSAVSGDMSLKLQALPQAMDLSTTSGDIWAALPDQSPFAVMGKTTSGDFTSDFFDGSMSGRWCQFAYKGGSAAGGPVYKVTTINGDITLRKIK